MPSVPGSYDSSPEEMPDLVLVSLELAADKAGDITPEIYRRYFASCPGSQDLMSHIDDLVRGKMMEEVFRLIMVQNYDEESHYLNFEVKNHKYAYSVQPHMYTNLLNAVHVTVKESVAEAWSPGMEDAWQTRIGRLISELEQRSSL
ncbi:MAG: globin [bacterium]|nr:globin [Gammaproteobacteria bacterium]HIL99310.1 globin [Pseudomonadales bacterium]